MPYNININKFCASKWQEGMLQQPWVRKVDNGW
jgi:hypothetical protein